MFQTVAQPAQARHVRDRLDRRLGGASEADDTGDVLGAGAPLAFLLPLGLGMAVAYWLVSRLLIGPESNPGILLRETTAPLCYGLFSGLVAVSLREPWRRIDAPQREHLAFAGAGAVATFVVLGLPFATSTPAGWMLPVGGALALTAMLLLYLIVQKTKMGTAMRAVSEDRDAAALMGIDVNKVITFTFILGGCMAGIGGALYAMVGGVIGAVAGWAIKDNVLD